MPDAALLLVGGGPYGKGCDGMVAAAGLESAVVLFTGAVPWPELPAHFDAGDVFAMPCRTRRGGLDVEGLGIVYLEASATGLPVVAGDSGGAPDAVLDGETGYVVDGRSVGGGGRPGRRRCWGTPAWRARHGQAGPPVGRGEMALGQPGRAAEGPARPAAGAAWPARRPVTPSPLRSPLPLRGRGPVLALAAAVVAGTVLRLVYLTTAQATLDGDEAMTAIMARRILAGRSWYAYLADQHYNGALEQYPQALLFAVAPDTAFTLRLVQVAIAAGVTVLVYLVGVRMLPTRWHASLAAALFALGPFFNIWKGVRSHGAYGTAQVLGLAGVYCALRLRGANGGAADGRWLAGLAFACGLAGWASWSAAYLLLPAVLWAAPALWSWLAAAPARDRPRRALALLAAATAGYLPALAWAVANRSLPLLGGPQPERSPLDRASGLFGPVLREFVGVGYFHGRPGWPLWAQYLAVAVLAAAYLAAVWRRRRGLAAVLTLRPLAAPPAAGDRRPGDLLLLVVPVTAVLYVASKYTWWTGEPRYLFAAYPALALGLAALAPRAGRAAVAAGTAVLVVVGATSLGQLARHSGDGPADLPGCLTSAAGWLSERGVRAVYSDYWTGLPLQFYAGEKLLVGPMGGGRGKFPAARRVLDADPDPVYVAGHVPDPMGQERDQVAVLDDAFSRHGVRARRTVVGCVVVYSDLRPVLRPWELGVGLPMPPGPPTAPGERS